ncbi:MAG: GumC family protein [Planktomarina sp.]
MTPSPSPSQAPVEFLKGATDEIDLTQLLRTLWRGKLWIIFCAIVTIFIGGYYAFVSAVPEYTSQATVTFESRDSQVVDIESVMGGLGGDQITINTEVEVLRSRGLIEKLVRRLNLLEDPEFNVGLRPEKQFSVGGIIRQGIALVSGPQEEKAPKSEQEVFNSVVVAVMEKIAITNIRQSYVFHISVVTQDPEKSALIANTLAQVYILDQLEVKFEATETATAWLTDRVGELQIALEAAVEEVKNFNSSSELISPETLAALNRQIKDLRERERDTKDLIEASTARLAALEAAQATNDIEVMAKQADDRSLTRILEIIKNQATPDRTTFDARYIQIMDRIKLDTSRAIAQADAFTKSVADLEAQVSVQSEDLVKLQQLEREAEASRLIYEYFLGRLKETSVQQGIQQADSRVLSSAVVPLRASSPRKPIILVLSALLGIIFGAATTLAREMSQNTFRTPEELEKLTGHTVMGQIPMIPARSRSNVLKYLTDKPTSAAAEAVRNLRTSTLLSNVDQPPQVIMSTSSLPGEGKTTQSISLAQNLSGLGKKVLLIEGDIRRRVFAEYFDIKGKEGLLAVLSGKVNLEDVAVFNEQLGADILVGEKSQVNAADVFSSDSFTEFLVRARQLYDFIIIDTPPVLVVPDARVIGQSMDAILYTVKWDHTTKRQVSEGLKSFASVNLRVTGLVLGQINGKGMRRYGYGDGYGAYGKYGRGYYDN